MADLNEVFALLSVHEKAHAHGGGLNNIAAAALARLRQIDAEHVGFGVAEPEPVETVAQVVSEPQHENEHELEPDPMSEPEPEPTHEEEHEEHE